MSYSWVATGLLELLRESVAPPALLTLYFHMILSKSILSHVQQLYVIILYRYACGVGVGDYYIVTGGFDPSEDDWALDTVAEYSQTGSVRALPYMKQGRFWHACSSFINGDGQTV